MLNADSRTRSRSAPKYDADHGQGTDGTCNNAYTELPADWELAPEPEAGAGWPGFNYGWGTHMGGARIT